MRGVGNALPDARMAVSTSVASCVGTVSDRRLHRLQGHVYSSGNQYYRARPTSNPFFTTLLEGYLCYAQKWVPELDTVDQAAQHRAMF